MLASKKGLYEIYHSDTFNFSPYWAGGEITKNSYQRVKQLPDILEQNKSTTPTVISVIAASGRAVSFRFFSKAERILEIEITDAYRKVILTDCQIVK